MDYEKKYKEALETARKINSGEGVPAPSGWTKLEVVFPELRESEDEIHRKWILEYLYDGLRKADEQFKDHFKSAIDWFEKQEEQKPNIELIQQSWYMEGYQDHKFNREPKWIVKTGEGGPKYELNPKYGQDLIKEQKPWTFNEPYNPDECEVVMEGNAISLKRKGQKSVDYDHEMWKNCEANFEGGKKEVIEHPERYGLQKTTKWSERESGILIASILALQESGNWALADKLKSLRPQPKAEWNEDDKRIYQHCLVILHDYGYDEWLKSFRCSRPWQEWSEEDKKNLSLVTEFIYKFYPYPMLKDQLTDWLNNLIFWKPGKRLY